MSEIQNSLKLFQEEEKWGEFIKEKIIYLIKSVVEISNCNMARIFTSLYMIELEHFESYFSY